MMATPTPWPAPVTSRPYVSRIFRAMGSPCRVVTDTDELARAGERSVHELEAAWSRFRDSSEVSRLNRAAGRICRVSRDTVRLVERAELARVLTSGGFQPLVLDRLEQLETGEHPMTQPSAIVDEAIEVFSGIAAARLPAGRRLDPGGIGKGVAGDLVVERLLELGATTVQVELGGDLRVAGTAWTGGHWGVDVVDPRDRGAVLARIDIDIDAGAVATSSVLGRRWTAGGRVLHHLIDPATGLPSDTDALSVTTTSSELWWAEVVAKVALMAGTGDAPDVMRRLGTAGLVVDRSGDVITVPTLEGGVRR